MVINNLIFGVELEDILAELKRQLDINGIALLGSMKNTPQNIQVSCPYHKGGQERKPSMGIHKQTGVAHCFTCGETHSLQEVISYCFGHTDDIIGGFGWNWLLKNFLTVSVEERKAIDLDISRGSRTKTEDIQYVSEKELDSYRYIHPYMYKRKLTDEVIEMFDIGYDKKSQCITFPIRDLTGQTLFVARRSVKTKYFNYPASATKPLYGLYELYKVARKEYNGLDTHILYNFPTEVIICESMLDALVFWTVGKYAVALNGLGTELQFKQLRELPCRKLILCTDSDDAGMQARTRIRKNVPNKIITEYLLPKGKKDANDCTQEELLTLEEIF